MDRLSQELRRIEREIDEVYKSNKLLSIGYDTAIWYVLAYIEDDILYREMKNENTPHLIAAVYDRYIFVMKHLVRWLKQDCHQGGGIPSSYTETYYEAADALVNLCLQYDDFYMAFIYASRGLIGLSVLHTMLLVESKFPDDTQYEAYNRLIRPIQQQASVNKDDKKMKHIQTKIDSSVKIRQNGFKIEIDYRLICTVMNVIRERINEKFTLPDDWAFSRYSLLEFKEVILALSAMVYIQREGRLYALKKTQDTGHDLLVSLLLIPKERLIKIIQDSTKLKAEVVSRIIFDLTLGNHNIHLQQLDPALQPLIPLDKDVYLIMPSLILGSAVERNLMVLLNKIPIEKKIYSSLVNQKEEVMKLKIISAINQDDWSVCSGRLPGRPELPDIDLAIISKSERVCLIVELKWFIDPAEAREIIEKSEEIEKGISQLIKLREEWSKQNADFFNLLGIDGTYTLGFAVISENWVGHAASQHTDVPTIRQSHITEKLKNTSSLMDVVIWLNSRAYLPIEGNDYSIVKTISRVGKWRTSWYHIKPLIEGGFNPM